MLLFISWFVFVFIFFLCVVKIGFNKAIVVSSPFVYFVGIYFLSMVVFSVFDTSLLVELSYYEIEFWDSGLAISWISISGLMGVYVYLANHKKNYHDFNFKVNKVSCKFLYVSVFLCFLLYLIGGEFEGFLYRDFYIETKAGFFYLIGSLAILVIPLFLGGVYGVSKGRVDKILALLGLIFVLLIYFSKGSKGLALIPFLFWFGLYLSDFKGRFSSLLLFLSFALFPILYSIAIINRQGVEHGLWPYLNNIMNYDGVFLLAFEIFMKSLSSNFYVFSETINYSDLYDFDSMLVMINPLPGSMAGWYDIFDIYRVHKFIPFSALGEAYNYGLVFSFVYFFIVGFLFSRVLVNFFFKKDNFVVFMIPFVLVIFFVAFSYSYNLRSVTRYIYYMIFFEVVVRVYINIVRKKVFWT